ncbi:hypothetical protein [Bacillus sp. 7884-1]|nr:hypothetical protein [Bacillus sp. 7884-1]
MNERVTKKTATEAPEILFSSIVLWIMLLMFSSDEVNSSLLLE